MTAYTTPTPARKPQTLHAWQEREYTQAYHEDQERPAHAASLKTVARYARLDTWTEGKAVCTADRRVFFLDGVTVTELSNADIPRLTLLGDVEVAEAQWTLDQLRRGYAGMATTRTN
jgi:hypothetical protein